MRCIAPYPPRLQRIAFISGSSMDSWKSFSRCLMVPAYLPDEAPAYLPVITFNPQDSNRFLAPLRNDLSILLDGDTMATLSPSFK